MNTPLTRGGAVFGTALVALSVTATVVIGTAINNEREYETSRADNALVALEQACQQVTRLGGHCITEPSDIEGGTATTAVPGPPGRAPTKAEIAAEVAAYLLAHPPSPGPAGRPGEQAPNMSLSVLCANIGGHIELLTIRLANGGESERGWFCVGE